MCKKSLWILLVAVVITLFSAVFLNIKSYDRPVGENLQLGQVDFPTSSRSPEAQAHFIQGMRYLHNFMYPLALREFTIANQIEPWFAMSYWGMAMSYQWPLWSFIDKAKGQKVLYAFQDVKNPQMTSLEKDLLQAVSLLYGEGSVIDNDKKYLEAMQKIYQQYPTNPDVASFYALALLGYVTDSPFDKDDDRYLQEARDILKPFLKTHPKHPGIIHYYIHAADMPNSVYPQEGLTVVDNIYKYLSDSSHVLHMPSHLYTELGKWEEGIHSNLLSIEASHRLCALLQKNNIHFDTPITICTVPRKDHKWTPKTVYACDADNLYHSTEWLQFEYLQLGQFEKAQQQVDYMKKVVDIENEPMYDFWFYRTLARQILYTKDWSPIKELPKPITKNNSDIFWAAYSECGMLLADGLRAIHNQQVSFLPAIEKRFQEIVALLKMRPEGGFLEGCLLTQKEFLAAKAFYSDKNFKESTKLLEEAMMIQRKIQTSQEPLKLPFIPAQELYAEILLHKPDQASLTKARDLFKEELKYYPNRRQAVIGLADVEARL